MLEIRRFSVAYGDNLIVRDASLTVPSGTITVLLGPNGTGKTTFLRAVCGLLPSSGGVVVVDGVDVSSQPTHKRGIGMLFQTTQLFPTLNVRDNVAFGLKQVRPRLAASVVDERINTVLDLVDMKDHEHDDVSTLSGGQCRRVDLARALAPRPSVLLCDEPMSMLDADTVASVLPRFREFIAAHGMSVVYITHDSDEARIVGDDVLQFSDITNR